MHAQVVVDRKMSTLTVATTSARVLHLQAITVNLDAATVSVAGRPVAASPAEFDLLYLLLQRRDVPMSKAAIMTELFGADHCRDERQVDVFVARLRKALATAGAGLTVQAVAGRGYALLDEDDWAASDVRPCDRPVLLAA